MKSRKVILFGVFIRIFKENAKIVERGLVPPHCPYGNSANIFQKAALGRRPSSSAESSGRVDESQLGGRGIDRSVRGRSRDRAR